MRVKISVFSILRKIVGKKSFYMDLRDGSTLRELIKELSRRYGEAFKEEMSRDMEESLTRLFNILVNGKSRNPSREGDLRLRNGDEILIVQPVGGG